MKFLKIIFTPILKFLQFIILPVFKFLRKILWDTTLRKFFNDKLKLSFIVGLIDDYLDVIEGIIKNPFSVLKFTDFSLFIIFAPWIINLLLFPIKKIQLARQQQKQQKQLEEYYTKLAETNPEYYQQLYNQQQMQMIGGASVMNVLSSSPGITDYISIYLFIFFMYIIEKRDICNKKHKKDSDKESYSNWKLIKIGLVFATIITLFYISIYLVFPFMPIIGIFFNIANSLPIIGTLVPGILTYIAYNIFRNITEMMKRRTQCV